MLDQTLAIVRQRSRRSIKRCSTRSRAGRQTERNVNIAMLQSTISALRGSISLRITTDSRFAKRLLGQFLYSAVGYPLTLYWQVLRTRSRASLRHWRATRAIVRSGLFDRERTVERDHILCCSEPLCYAASMSEIILQLPSLVRYAPRTSQHGPVQDGDACRS